MSVKSWDEDLKEVFAAAHKQMRVDVLEELVNEEIERLELQNPIDEEAIEKVKGLKKELETSNEPTKED